MPKSTPEKKMFKARTLKFELYELCNKLQISLHLPDLSRNKIVRWGDWGPNYDVELKQHQSARLVIEDVSNGMLIERELHLGHMLIESPMLAVERERSPLVCNIKDPSSCLSFYLSYSREGELIASEINRKSATWFPKWEPEVRLSA